GGAVRFDDDVLLRPSEVGDHAAAVQDERNVHARVREPTAENDVEHGILEFAASGRRPGRDDLSKTFRAAAWAETSEDLDKLAGGHTVQRLRLADGPAERAVGELRGEVEERPGGRGDGDPVVTSEVVRLEGRRAVDAQAGVDPRPRS